MAMEMGKTHNGMRRLHLKVTHGSRCPISMMWEKAKAKAKEKATEEKGRAGLTAGRKAKFYVRDHLR